MSFHPELLFFAASAAVVYGAAQWQRLKTDAQKAEADAALRERLARIARQRDWVLTDTTLAAEVNGVSVTIEQVRREDAHFLRFFAPTQAPTGFSLTINRDKGRGTLFGKPFDQLFDVQTSDEGLARVWFDKAALHAFRVAALEEHKFQVYLGEGRVIATVVWPDATGEDLTQLATLIAIISGGWSSVTARWAEIARSLGSETRIGHGYPLPMFVIGRGPFVVQVELERRDAWRTRVSFVAATSGQSGERYLEGIVLDRERIEAEIEALLASAKVNDGPYR